MTLRYLLDTNVVSEPLKLRPRDGVLQNIRYHQEEIAIPSIVWHELWYGALRLPLSHRRTAIERYLQEVIQPTIPILDYDQEAAAWHAAERARLATQGEMPPFVDGQIAAIAQTNDLALVTFNDADFRRFDGLRVLTWK